MKKIFKIVNDEILGRTSGNNFIHLETLPMSNKTLVDLLNEAYQFGCEMTEDKIQVAIEKAINKV